MASGRCVNRLEETSSRSSDTNASFQSPRSSSWFSNTERMRSRFIRPRSGRCFNLFAPKPSSCNSVSKLSESGTSDSWLCDKFSHVNDCNAPSSNGNSRKWLRLKSSLRNRWSWNISRGTSTIWFPCNPKCFNPCIVHISGKVWNWQLDKPSDLILRSDKSTDWHKPPRGLSAKSTDSRCASWPSLVSERCWISLPRHTRCLRFFRRWMWGGISLSPTKTSKWVWWWHHLSTQIVPLWEMSRLWTPATGDSKIAANISPTDLPHRSSFILTLTERASFNPGLLSIKSLCSSVGDSGAENEACRQCFRSKISCLDNEVAWDEEDWLTSVSCASIPVRIESW